MLSGKDANDLINVDHSTIKDVHHFQTRLPLRGYVLLKVRKNEQQKDSISQNQHGCLPPTQTFLLVCHAIIPLPRTSFVG